MKFSQKPQSARWIILATSFAVILLILWNTYRFFQVFKNEERLKMTVLAESMKTIDKADLLNDEIELPLQIISNNKTIPVIVTDSKGRILNTANLSEQLANDSVYMKRTLARLKKENEPILMASTGSKQYLYYGNSELLNSLKYFPIALLLIIFLFIALIYNYYRSVKIGSENKLWAGMAKETAHQIGTPLSSLLGWIEILRSEHVEESTVQEIEKDVARLQTIADRFSKIGSEPVLESLDLVAETEKSYAYLKSRFAGQVTFTFNAPTYPIYRNLNPVLHSWTIENLVKNAIDAMRGRGAIDLTITDDGKQVRIFVSDTGKGIAKHQFKRIFEPGFTTKKRGWGLGLSLTKRIVEEYHKGKIAVTRSEIGKGTTIEVSL